ncbi:MAG: S-layer family protein [Spirirestis rafaelensis WJT71-NPBG6]|nr:S-layer family protein [Spirirestis rafaelensis WJT71-NPBG6]
MVFAVVKNNVLYINLSRMVGGNVSMDGGQLNANGGRVELGGLTQAGTIFLNVDSDNLSLIFPDNVARSEVSLTNSSGVFVTGTGGGSIAINAQNLNLTQGSKLEAGITSGLGNGDTKAGNIEINSTGNVSFNGEGSGAYYQVKLNAIGNAGNINVTAGSLSVTNGGELNTSTRGQGNAGNVNVNARDTVSFVGESPNNRSSRVYSRVEEKGVGQAGDIYIKTGSLSVSDGAYLSASTSGIGDTGDVTIDARDTVRFDGAGPAADDFFPSGARSQVEENAGGNGGSVNITTGSLSVTNGAELIVSSFGQGGAGDLIINARNTVRLDNQSRIGATTIVGNGGNITIDSGSFSLRDGASVTASTFGQGNAGTIKVNAADFFIISGSSSNLNTGLFVNSQSPTRTAGNIIVTSPRVTLDNGGRLSAESASGNGGDINLQSNLLLLRRSGQISTNAGTAPAGGNGGNINIDTGFIVAVPQENSDITANAFSGNGGTVTINAQGIFGIQPRQEPTEQSDITASSTGGGINGVVNINTLDIDPSRGFIDLPTNVVNTSRLVAQSCSAFGKGGSEFTVTGRGGLPDSPDDFLSSDVVWSDTRLTALPVSRSPRVTPSVRKTAEGVAIVPATGWVFDEKKGEVTLIASNETSSGVGSNQVNCVVP